MAGIRLFEEQLHLTCPHTYNALQKLVMAMASVHKNTGKKTWLGKDKGQESYSGFLLALKVTLHCMILDCLITESTKSAQVLETLNERLSWFEMAFPNWPDAYEFSTHYFKNRREDAITAIERLRSIP